MRRKAPNIPEGTPAVRTIESAKALKQAMEIYFTKLFDAAKTGERKIAWCTSVGPSELLTALGFLVYFPENHGAMLGASRASTDLIPSANAIGYSPEVCSYLTSDIGSFIKCETPMAKMPGFVFPKPDVLVYNTNQCRDVKEWMSYYKRRYDVPLLGIETPRGIDEVTDVIIEPVAKQLEALIEPLSRISGRKFDYDKLKEVVGLSKALSERWKDVLETAEDVPSPINFFDCTIHMAPAVVMRGLQGAIDYYDILLAELKARTTKGIGSIADERFRIYWEGMPIWGKLREHSDLFAKLKMCVVASTYCNSWIFDSLDADDPFRSMAWAYSETFIVRSESFKERYLRRMIGKYMIDGMIYHDAKTCPYNSNTRYGLPQRLVRKTGAPYIVVQGDFNDMRCFSEEQTKTNIEAFAEQLGE